MLEPANQFDSYLVGGAVRDALLGIAVSDRDYVVVGALPEDLISQGFEQVGKDFPCFLHPKTKEEYSLARTERKSGSGYTGFVCEFGPDVGLEEDLRRRDLTINAMAQSDDGQLIDPFGGQRDLQEKWLRHVSPAFDEDPLRVLRVARFAARFAHLGFRVHPDTLALMAKIAAGGELQTLTTERVWKETSRALSEISPSIYFKVLRDCHALAVLFPEIDALFGVPQRAEYHPEVDTGVHVLLCIDHARQHFNDLQVTYAVLLHDLGKGITPEDELPKHLGHEETGVPLVKAVNQRLKVPKDYAALAELVCRYHLQCHRLGELRPGTVLKLIESLDGLRRPERVELFTQACQADAQGRLGFENQAYPQAQRLIDCVSAAKAVDVKPLLEKGYQGKALVEPLKQARIKAVAQVLASKETDH